MKYQKEFKNKISIFTVNFNKKFYTFEIKGKNRRAKCLELLLETYPKYLSIHDKIITDLFDDPNKAMNEFLHDECYIAFVDEKKITSQKGKKISSFKLNLNKVTAFLDSGGLIKSNNRENLSLAEQKLLLKKHNSRCAITGYKLKSKKELNNNKFMNKLLTINFDHRIPLFKDGTNNKDNWMLISEYVNQEKNKICKVCEEPSCEDCALAYPEKTSVILPSKQNLKSYFIIN